MTAISIYLASKSPRRRELLSQIGVAYEVLEVDVEERRGETEEPASYVRRLSKDKAIAGALMKDDRPVLGADTIVVLGDKVLEKPLSKEHGVEMLLQLSGKTHQVMTAVTVSYNAFCKTCINKTQVTFRELSRQEAEIYWETGEPCDKAGAYGIQGLGAIFVREIRGSYSSVVGLPLLEVSQLLSDVMIKRQ